MGEGERNRAPTARITDEALEKLAASATPPEQRPTTALDPTALRALLADSGAAAPATGSQPIAATIPAAPPAADPIQGAPPTDEVIELDDDDKRTQAVVALRRPVHRFATGSEHASTPLERPIARPESVIVDEPAPPAGDTVLVILAALLILALAGGIVFLMLR